MVKLTIAHNPTFKLPLDVMTMATAVLGLRGSGKTNTAGVWTEELLKQGQQVVVIDPQNVWWGLKSSADGKAAGFPVVIFGGNHADVPLLGTEGKVLADFVVEKQVSCIFSLRHLTLSAQTRFVTDFAEQLFFRKGEERYQTPCLVVIDEAHKFVPQKVDSGRAMLVHRIQMLVAEGRASGIGVTLIDQRAATVNKDVLTQVEMLVCHRTSSPQDKNALDEWIRDNAQEGQAAEFRQSLAKLPVGKAWFWSPGWLDVFEQVQVRKRETFDSSATPRAGEKRIEPKKLADIDLDELRESLAATIETAEANDPKKLKSRIAVLEKELALKTELLENAPKETEKVPVLDQEALDKLETAFNDFILEQSQILGALAEQIHEASKTAIDRLGTTGLLFTALFELERAEPKLPAKKSWVEIPKTKPIGHYPADRVAAKMVHEMMQPKAAPRPEPSGDLKISPTQQRILDALAFYESIGNRSPSLVQIGAVALIDATGGHFSNVTGPLSTNGLVTRAHGTMSLTDVGRSYATVAEAPRSLSAYHDVLRSRVRKMKSASGRTIDVLDVIIAAGGQPVTSEHIGSSIGIDHTGGHFSNTIGPLSTAGLITRSGGVVTPTSVLFPEGLS